MMIRPARRPRRPLRPSAGTSVRRTAGSGTTSDTGPGESAPARSSTLRSAARSASGSSTLGLLSDGSITPGASPYAATLVSVTNCRWDKSRSTADLTSGGLRPGQSLHLVEGVAKISSTMPGGGVALLRAKAALSKMTGNGDEKAGVDIVATALEGPARIIAANAGAEGSIVVEKVKAGKGAMGYNAATGEYEDLVVAGIVDPTKVTRSALQHAASIAALMLTTEAVVTDIPEEEKPMPGGGGGMGMGGME